MTDFDMREHIRQSNMIENIYDEAEITQSLVAWNYLLQGGPLTHDLICGAQRVITNNQQDLPPAYKGVYRHHVYVNVMVGNYQPPRYQEVQRLMNRFLAEHGQRAPWENHVFFESVHPFADGNGRTGRMLMWHQEVELGQEPTLFLAKNRFRYYNELDQDNIRATVAGEFP